MLNLTINANCCEKFVTSLVAQASSRLYWHSLGPCWQVKRGTPLPGHGDEWEALRSGAAFHLDPALVDAKMMGLIRGMMSVDPQARLEAFAEAFTAHNAGVFDTPDVCYILAFSVIMLDTRRTSSTRKRLSFSGSASCTRFAACG